MKIAVLQNAAQAENNVLDGVDRKVLEGATLLITPPLAAEHSSQNDIAQHAQTMARFAKATAHAMKCSVIYCISAGQVDGASRGNSVGYHHTGKLLFDYLQGNFLKCLETQPEKELGAVIGIDDDLFDPSFPKCILESKARLVILQMKPILLGHPQTPRRPNLDILSSLIENLEPLMNDDLEYTIHVVFACGCTSAVVGIQGSNINVYGILGPCEEKPLVVDFSTQPNAKLIRDEKGPLLVDQSSSGNWKRDLDLVGLSLKFAKSQAPLQEFGALFRVFRNVALEANVCIISMVWDAADQPNPKLVLQKLLPVRPHYLIVRREVEGSATADLQLPRVMGPGSGGLVAVHAHLPIACLKPVHGEDVHFPMVDSRKEHYLYRVEYRKTTYPPLEVPQRPTSPKLTRDYSQQQIESAERCLVRHSGEYKQAQQEPALQQVHDNKGKGQNIIQKGGELGARESEGITQTMVRFGGPVSDVFVQGRQSVGEGRRYIVWQAPTPPSMPPSTETETGLLNDQAADKADTESEREADGQEVEA